MSLEQIIILASCIALALFITPFLAQKPWILRLLAKEIRDRDSHQNQHQTLGVSSHFRFYCNDCYIQCRAEYHGLRFDFYFAMLGLMDDLFDIHGVKTDPFIFLRCLSLFFVFDISESLENFARGNFYPFILFIF